VTLSDPSDRRLRGEISAAVRNGQPELEAELRRELALRNVERCLVKQLGDRPLTTMELRRLRVTLEQFGPERVA
jgi:type II secretory pathway predicted ATPase ExeA